MVRMERGEARQGDAGWGVYVPFRGLGPVGREGLSGIEEEDRCGALSRIFQACEVVGLNEGWELFFCDTCRGPRSEPQRLWWGWVGEFLALLSPIYSGVLATASRSDTAPALPFRRSIWTPQRKVSTISGAGSERSRLSWKISRNSLQLPNERRNMEMVHKNPGSGR